MAWNNPDELVIGANGQISAAPVGTTLPTTTTGALDAAFVGMGYVTQDGVTWSQARENNDVPVWQEFDPVRTVMTGRQVQASFGLVQWNEETLPFALGGGTITGSTPNYKFTPAAPEDLDERSLVLDTADGDNHVRIVIKRGIVVDTVETTFQRGEPAVFPVTFRMLAAPDGGEPYYILSDAPGFAAGS